MNRSNSVLIVAPLSAFEICGFVAPLLLSSKILHLEPSFLSKAYRPRLPQSFYNPDRPQPVMERLLTLPESWDDLDVKILRLGILLAGVR
ncbi:MAG: hypothetical protein WCF68_04310 [Terriglobales bacterium]